MDDTIRSLRTRMHDCGEISSRVRDVLSLEYDLLCLDDPGCVDYISSALASGAKEMDLSGIPASYAMDVEMIVSVWRSLETEDREKILSSIETLRGLLSEVSRCKDELGGRFRYLRRLLGDDLFFKFAVEVENFSQLVRVTPSEMMKYGMANHGAPLLSQHVLVAGASPENQGKMLRKLCYKVSIAVKLDLCGSDFEIDLYRQMEDIFHKLEHREQGGTARLPTPLARKTTRRGGMKTKRKRGQQGSRKKRLLGLGGEEEP